MTPTDDQLRETAWPESGHGLAGVLVGSPFELISIRPGEGYAGIALGPHRALLGDLAMYAPAIAQPPELRAAIERSIATSLAGPLAGLAIPPSGGMATSLAGSVRGVLDDIRPCRGKRARTTIGREREALTRGPHPGRRDRAEPLARPTREGRHWEGTAMRTWLARRVVVVLVVVAVFALGGSVVLAAIPTGGGTIYACYGKSSGAMRVVNYPSVKCTSSERLLSWTQVGPKAPPLAAIGIQTFGHLDNSFDINPDPNATILRVWAETGSASAKCLATLAEALQPAPRVDQLFCASRRLTVDGTARDGVYLTMILQEQLRDGSYYDVNVYQEGARFYGTPIKCDPTIEGC